MATQVATDDMLVFHCDLPISLSCSTSLQRNQSPHTGNCYYMQHIRVTPSEFRAYLRKPDW